MTTLRLLITICAVVLATCTLLVDGSVPNPPVAIAIGQNETDRLTSALMNTTTGYSTSVTKRVCYSEIVSLAEQIYVGKIYIYVVKGCAVLNVTAATCAPRELASCKPEPFQITVYTQDNTTRVDYIGTARVDGNGTTGSSDKSGSMEGDGHENAVPSPASTVSPAVPTPGSVKSTALSIQGGGIPLMAAVATLSIVLASVF